MADAHGGPSRKSIQKGHEILYNKLHKGCRNTKAGCSGARALQTETEGASAEEPVVDRFLSSLPVHPKEAKGDIAMRDEEMVAGMAEGSAKPGE